MEHDQEHQTADRPDRDQPRERPLGEQPMRDVPHGADEPPTTADQNATAGTSGVEPRPASTVGDGGGDEHGNPK